MTELQQAVLDAQTVPERLASLSRLAWAADHDDAECPADMIASETALAEWLPFPPDAHAGSIRHLAAMRLIGPDAEPWTLDPDSPLKDRPPPQPAAEDWRWAAIDGRTAFALRLRESNPDADVDAMLDLLDAAGMVAPPHLVLACNIMVAVWEIEDIDARWLEIFDPERPLPHPLAPIVRAWQEWKAAQPREVVPFIPKRRGSLVRLHRIDETETMPDFARDSENQQYAFTGEGFTPAIDCIPHWILALYDTKRGLPLQEGRTAPRSMRLLAGAFLHLSRADRNGKLASLKLPLGYVIRWLHPDFEDEGDPRSMGDLWAGRDDWQDHWRNWRRDWEAFPKALQVIDDDLGRALVGNTMKRVAAVSDIPLTPDQDMVEFWLRIPKIAADGMPVDWRLLCWLGKYHPIGYRAMFAAVPLLDRSAKNGYAQTRAISPPLVDAQGKKVQQKGKLVRDPSKLELNPGRFRSPVLSDGDLATAIGLDRTNRKNRTRARGAFELLDHHNAIDLEETRGGVRILGPRPVRWKAETNDWPAC